MDQKNTQKALRILTSFNLFLCSVPIAGFLLVTYLTYIEPIRYQTVIPTFLIYLDYIIFVPWLISVLVSVATHQYGKKLEISVVTKKSRAVLVINGLVLFTLLLILFTYMHNK